MNAQAQARTAYSQHGTPIRTPRGSEYEIFAKITHALRAAALKGRPGFAALATAIHDNRRLWTLLASDVADEANKLPKDLRARIFYLAEFTGAHSAKVLNEGASVAPLIEINAMMMRGLRGEQGAAG
ncbi:flagellar biosynthesis regulator FlaF [Aquicoccus sp. G2-2]|uniref:flagellar biosynthesis regulator FlaF n=1 Tax=Aquicoccus sp. G2-2 TaxID=3092120 RepID=UPI002ADF94BE|nr:flagellar biosynthesis regulator FlaF [Aquicoccus sp. G2-2]MEA1114411.1 flagellar biosynthesis regulator FlaF [Aquicoccus sp. G2-2]